MRTAPIALTCGEPAGVGIEIALKAYEALRDEIPFFLITDRAHIGAEYCEISDPAMIAPGPLPVLHHDFDGARIPGAPNPEHAKGVIDVIARAVKLTKSGAASAICTLPINKKALKDGAGFTFPGHTEYLADLDGKTDVVMMLACPDLRVVPATIHIPLAEVPSNLTEGLLERTIKITARALQQDFGIDAPNICVAGLNPHAGEGGTMGREEIEMIAPLIARLSAEGLNLSGPRSADTMFHADARAGYDAAICMYHDQALIPIKTIDFAGGVNVTLGLSFIRTSPDHGTAFDIASKGTADPSSLIAALRMAWDMACRRTA